MIGGSWDKKFIFIYLKDYLYLLKIENYLYLLGIKIEDYLNLLEKID